MIFLVGVTSAFVLGARCVVIAVMRGIVLGIVMFGVSMLGIVMFGVSMLGIVVLGIVVLALRGCGLVMLAFCRRGLVMLAFCRRGLVMLAFCGRRLVVLAFWRMFSFTFRPCGATEQPEDGDEDDQTCTLTHHGQRR